MDLGIVNLCTGEVVGKLDYGDRIIKKNSMDFLREQEKAPKSETFTKLYHAIVPVLSECGLTASEFMVFIYLSTNLRYQSNVSKYSNGKLITRHSIETDLSMTDKTVKRTISSLIRHGLIAETSTKEGKVFIVNPFVVCVGDTMSKTVYDLFRKSKWARW